MPSSDKNKNTQRHHTRRAVRAVAGLLSCGPGRRRQLLVSENLTCTQPSSATRGRRRAEIKRKQGRLDTRVVFKSCWARQRLFEIENTNINKSNSEQFGRICWFSHSLSVSLMSHRDPMAFTSQVIKPRRVQLMDPNQREMSRTSLPNQTNK